MSTNARLTLGVVSAAFHPSPGPNNASITGSTTVYPHGDPTYAPIELGASIFVDANKNLMRASKEFNLSFNDFGDEFSDTGIWDGSKFVLVVSTPHLDR